MNGVGNWHIEDALELVRLRLGGVPLDPAGHAATRRPEMTSWRRKGECCYEDFEMRAACQAVQAYLSGDWLRLHDTGNPYLPSHVVLALIIDWAKTRIDEVTTILDRVTPDDFAITNDSAAHAQYRELLALIALLKGLPPPQD